MNLESVDLFNLDNFPTNITKAMCQSHKVAMEKKVKYGKPKEKEEKLKKLGEKKDAPKYN